MSNRALCLVALASLAGTAACTDRPATTAPERAETGAAAVTRSEALARRLALALSNPIFRTYLKTQLDASPIRERKLHFQRFLAADGRRALLDVARLGGGTVGDVEADAAAAVELEIYIPVPAHRAAWRGDANVLVATALTDHEAPVAFDPQGNRLLLSPEQPPATPVIALVPVETDFTSQPSLVPCLFNCGGGGSPPTAPGLYMTKAHFVDDFEGWLKGAPEFEVHILGQKGTTDSLTAYQCAGGAAAGPYYFDQNGKDWSGYVLLFSATQIANYNVAHPNQNFRVFFVEDDDTACLIKANKDLMGELLKAVDGAAKALAAGNDSSNTYVKVFKRASGLQKAWSSLASFIKTNDELVGNAVEDDVVGAFYPGYNWIVKGTNNVTNGWVNLEIK
ncbi:MAG TPA: hypothetical protein VFU41_12980 [Gemmatimonadales bacterium]|nr:hypothetical protein [Gemmatimonadales bacterium]